MTGQVLVIDGAGTLYELENASAPDTQHRFTNSWVMNSEYSSVFFFFSSRRRHTRFDCDWSSDVCSSDLAAFHRRRHVPLEQLFLTRLHHREPDAPDAAAQQIHAEQPGNQEIDVA